MGTLTAEDPATTSASEVMKTALRDALVSLAQCDDMSSSDAGVQQRRITIRSLSRCVYGNPLRWSDIPAYMHVAQVHRDDLDVLPLALAQPFLEVEQ